MAVGTAGSSRTSSPVARSLDDLRALTVSFYAVDDSLLSILCAAALILLRHSHTPHQLFEARISTLTIENWVDGKPQHELCLVVESFIQPGKLLILFPKGEIDQRDRCRRDIRF